MTVKSTTTPLSRMTRPAGIGRPGVMTRAIAAIVLLGPPLAACKSDRVITGSVPVSIEERYPIGVVPERRKLDLNATGYGLSRPDKQMTEEFILSWRQRGSGGLEVLTPVGTANETEALSVVEEVKAIAYNYGMPVDAVHVVSYRTAQAYAPVRLAYERMVTTLECGAWPTNAATDWRNLPYENYGCATQKNLAAMVEDPRDLEGPRPVWTPRDGERRDTVYEKYREGKDPSTQYEDVAESGTVSDLAE